MIAENVDMTNLIVGTTKDATFSKLVSDQRCTDVC